MSGLVIVGERIVPFSTFLLSESILPKETKFGTDKEASNKNVDTLDGEMFWTIVKHNDFFFLVYHSKDSHYCGFGFSNSWNGDLMREIEKFEQGSKNVGTNALRVFGNIFYVLIRIIKKSKSNIVKFDAADIKLGKVYDKMVKNKPFLNALEKEGWVFKEKTGDDYIFTVKT